MTSTTINAIPQMMQASVLTGPKQVEVQEVAVPTVGSKDVLVRVDAVGVCGSDAHFYRAGRIGNLVVAGPIVLGHETAGVIVAVGELVDPSRVGQRVSIEPQRPCRRCEYCLGGDYNQCRDIEFYGAYPTHGSFAQYAVIPDDFAYLLPDHLSMAEGALIEPLSVAVYACRKATVGPGTRVLIAGAGPIGVLTAQVAHAFGASEVIISDPQEHRRAFAERFTGVSAISPSDLEPDVPIVDVFIDASGAPAAIAAGIRAVRALGKVVLVGMGMDDVSLPVALMQHREITLTGTFRYAHTWPLAIELAANGSVNLSELVTSVHALDDVEAAMLAATIDPTSIKTLVLPNGQL
ncbi:NAD(P)-dependent alcohol dehydrogenase [Cryobacterium lactosi]|uniref:NAD(P)-dependent alcohol dehydrogenase n=1 Tax=Cryobacterium lactosi TaxID=1259202 RepID=A0A4R9BRC8_9MICO|nr:NAD(P)-dependent alcohol dehydrogenase [Cryobacterium lactosi]TFD89370.1 NAD(P)-dependent alcohol dehydrogenase [Cryobacterium lactosi]